MAFAFLRRADLETLSEGWIDLEEGVRASVQHYATMPADTLDFETHERFFDIQYLVEGIELVGFVDRNRLDVKVPYNPESDITFYEDTAHAGAALLHAGDYVLLTPEDAHKPRVAAGEGIPVKKIVMKVPV